MSAPPDEPLQPFGTRERVTKPRTHVNRRKLSSHPVAESSSPPGYEPAEASEASPQAGSNGEEEARPGTSWAAEEPEHGAAWCSGHLQRLRLGDAEPDSHSSDLPSPQFITSSAPKATSPGVQVQVPQGQVQYDSKQVVEAGWKGMLHLDVDADALPLIGDRQGLQQLASEYHRSSSKIIQKIERLCRTYSGLRRSRGDGNCAYRSFLFAYLEGVAERADSVEAGRMAQLLAEWDATLRQEDHPPERFAAGVLWLTELLNSIGTATVAEVMEDLMFQMRNWATSMQAIQFVRFICASEIARRADHFAPFIIGLTDGALDVLTFNQRHVAMMGEESDHIQLVALTDALKVPVHVVYLDGQAASGAASDECPHHIFLPQGYDASPSTAPTIHVLYRPGHYDVLYPA